MKQWRYNKTIVQVPKTAEIPYQYRLGARWDNYVQQALNEVPPWKGRVQLTEETTYGFDFRVPLIVAPVNGRQITWAVHDMHRATSPDLSPFIYCKEEVTDTFTVVLAGTTERPVLVRAFPGEFIPPLPWQHHATNASLKESQEFWGRHAYVCAPGAMRRHSSWPQAPEWYTALVS